MRTIKIVADSSANLMELNTVAFDAAPLKVITAKRDFVDNRNLDLEDAKTECRRYLDVLKSKNNDFLYQE